MKKGISYWSFKEASLDECFSLAKNAGFEGVEVVLDETTGPITLNSTYEEVMEIKKLAQKHNISLYSVASGLYWTYPLSHNDSEISKKAKEIVKKQIDVAKWLDCDTILVVPGTVDEEHSYDTVYERSLNVIKELASYAEENKIIIGVENVWNKFLLSPLEMRDFIDEIDSPYVKAYFDVGNVMRDGYPQQWIRILGDKIAKIHFKDFNCSVGTLEGFVDLLSGSVNYPAVMEALEEIGYDGWVTGELSVYKDYPDTLLKTASCAMDAILGRKS